MCVVYGGPAFDRYTSLKDASSRLAVSLKMFKKHISIIMTKDLKVVLFCFVFQKASTTGLHSWHERNV